MVAVAVNRPYFSSSRTWGRALFKGPLNLSVILTLGLEGLMRLEHGRDELLGRAEQARQSSIVQHLEAVRTRLLDDIRFAGRQDVGVSLPERALISDGRELHGGDGRIGQSGDAPW